jgi:hypothetical protein
MIDFSQQAEGYTSEKRATEPAAQLTPGTARCVYFEILISDASRACQTSSENDRPGCPETIWAGQF